jgi:hypothetical protein
MSVATGAESRQVQGPAPTRNQVRSIALVVDALPGGRLRLRSPFARGWSRVVATRDELNRAVNEAFTEVQIASYAQWRGQAYDLDVTAPVYHDDPETAATPIIQARSVRADVHDPAAWVPLDDGRWRSPGGKIYKPDADVVRRVRAKRKMLGLD